MKKSVFILLGLLSTLFVQAQESPRYTVGLVIMATGKYTVFLNELIQSADCFFLPNHDKIYFIFTDGEVPKLDRVRRIEQKRLGWPFDTMMRFEVYFNSASEYTDVDYLFACDADLLFVDTIGDEILGERVATRHPGFSLPEHRRDDYERDLNSTAGVKEGEGQAYFAGGFYGGRREEFLKMAFTCGTNIKIDLEYNIIAKWHDESHLNRYFIDNPPTLILSPSYCFPEQWLLPFEPKIIALDKLHKEFREG